MTNDAFSASPSLALAHEAARGGDRRLAHEICVQLVAEDPTSEQTWLCCADTADSLEETITALSRAIELNPANDVARLRLYEAMQGLLHQDAFLAYKGESDDFYQVATLTEFEFAHPKDRAVPEPFPPPAPPPAQTAFRWLALSLVGLLPAGLGTLVCAPMAVLAAVSLLRNQPSRADRRRAWVALSVAIALWLIALVFFAIFLAHIP